MTSKARQGRILKEDLFGRVELCETPEGERYIRRDLGAARWWTRPIARYLARREARVLAALAGLAGVPSAKHWDGHYLERSYLDGQPMQVARPRDEAYFRQARRLLMQLHRRNVVHNDTAKEPNWLVLADGTPGLIDFQLASVSRRRGCFFRTLAREDLRHLLKHKRTYLPDALSRREKAILARRAWPSRLWMALIKPPYLFITRRVFGWSDREGASDRGGRDLH